MNKDQIKGTVKGVAGKVEKEAGKMFGSARTQVYGSALQAEGKTQKHRGDVEQVQIDARKAIMKAATKGH
jgi:uncharacterized protein YjbJ (UPF0337 family)